MQTPGSFPKAPSLPSVQCFASTAEVTKCMVLQSRIVACAVQHKDPVFHRLNGLIAKNI